MDLVHPYEKLTLVQVGWPVAAYLLATHAFMLAKPAFCKEWLVKLPRHYNAGVIVMSIAMGWFWLLVAPESNSVVPWLSSLSRDLAEFNTMKPMLRIAVPAFCIGMCLYAKEFLFVRGLGTLALMVAGPLLQAAMFKDEATRVLIPIFGYMLVTAGVFCVGMPYLFRDLINWVLADGKRYTALVLGGLGYGVAVLICTLAFW